MMELKACPRCRGDMRVDHDMYGDFKQCIQCGNSIELKQTTRRRLVLADRLRAAQTLQDSAPTEPAVDLALSDA